MEVPHKPLQTEGIGRVRVKMRKSWLLSAVAIVTVALLSIQEGYCGKTIDLDKPDQSEVMEEVAKFTGLTKDVVELVNEEHAELFKGLDNTVFALKVVSLITEAKDTEALTEIGTKALEIVKDALVKEAFPAAVGTFFTVASVCKTSLELIRDYKWIPGYEEKIYRLYKKQRDTAPTAEGPEVWEAAFWMGIGMVPGEGLKGLKDAGGYYVVKGKMLDQVAKEKMNLKSKEELGPQALKMYNKQVDDFWINWLEMRYQKERMKERQAELIKEIWDKKAQQIEALKAAAGKMAGPERFFLTDKDIPQGWKRVMARDANRPFTPRNQPGGGPLYQSFSLYNAEYTEKVIPTSFSYDNNEFFRSDGKKVVINTIFCSVTIQPRIWTSSQGTAVDRFDTHIKNLPADWARHSPNRKVFGEFMGEGVLLGYVVQGSDIPDDSYKIMFVKGLWYVDIRIDVSHTLSDIQKMEARDLESSKGKRVDIYDKTMASGGLVRTLAQVVARKIPAPEPKKTEAKKK